MERQVMPPRPRAFDLGDPRTPMAWQHRNFNFQQEHQQLQQTQQYYHDRFIGGVPISPTEMLHHPSDSCDDPTLGEMYHHHQYVHQQQQKKQQLHHQQYQHLQEQQARAVAMGAAKVTAGLDLPVAMISVPHTTHPHPHSHPRFAHTSGVKVVGGAETEVMGAVEESAVPASLRSPRTRSYSTGRSMHLLPLPLPHAASQPALSTSSNSSATSDSTGLDSESQLRADAALPPTDLHQLPVNAPTLGTLRSVQSTLTTWDGEPCPVHHMQVPMGLLLSPPSAQLYPVMAVPLPAPPQPPPPPPLPPPPPSVLLPPMLRPRPLVLAAEAAGRPEPLPVRDPKTSGSPLPPKEGARSMHCLHCCRGSIIVLWVVLGIIFVGILLAVILRFVIA